MHVCVVHVCTCSFVHMEVRWRPRVVCAHGGQLTSTCHLCTWRSAGVHVSFVHMEVRWCPRVVCAHGGPLASTCCLCTWRSAGVHVSFVHMEVRWRPRVVCAHGGPLASTCRLCTWRSAGVHVSFACLPQVFLNYLSNYLTQEWREGKCVSCVEEMVPVPQELPTVFVGVFIDQPTPFLKQFLDRLAALSYPKKKMSVFLRNNVSFHSNMKWSCVSSVLYCRWSTTMRWRGRGSNRMIKSIGRCTT